jgi:hypothetical protein
VTAITDRSRALAYAPSISGEWPDGGLGDATPDGGSGAMSAAVALGLAAGLTQAAAYAVYMSQVLRGDCRPNGMTWLMWSYGAFVFFAIELHLGAPWPVLALPAICMTCAFAVSIYAFATGAYLRPHRHDWVTLGFDAAIMLGYAVWAAFFLAAGRVEGAGLAFVALAGVSALTSSWPALRTTYLEPGNERPLAWFVWSTAYGLLALSVMAEGLAWPFLVYPVACQGITFLIGLFALDGFEAAKAADAGAAADAQPRSPTISTA